MEELKASVPFKDEKNQLERNYRKKMEEAHVKERRAKSTKYGISIPNGTSIKHRRSELYVLKWEHDESAQQRQRQQQQQQQQREHY